MLGLSEPDSTLSGLIEVESRAVEPPAGRPAPVVPVLARPASFPSSPVISSPCLVPGVCVGTVALLPWSPIIFPPRSTVDEGVPFYLRQPAAARVYLQALTFTAKGGIATFALPCLTSRGNGSRYRFG